MVSISDITEDSLNYPYNGISKVIVTGLIYLLAILFLVTSLTFVFSDFMALFSISFSYNPIAIPSAMLCLIFAVIVFLILIGYKYRVIEKTIMNEDRLPKYENIYSMLIQGFKIALIDIIYQIIPCIVLILGFVFFGLSKSNGALIYLAIFFVIVGLILSLFFGFFTVMAINNLVAHNKFSKAFSFNEIWSLIKSVGILKFIGTIIVLNIVQIIILIAISLLIGFLFFIAAIFGPFAGFSLIIILAISLLAEAYFMIYMARGYGLLYLEAQ